MQICVWSYQKFQLHALVSNMKVNLLTAPRTPSRKSEKAGTHSIDIPMLFFFFFLSSTKHWKPSLYILMNWEEKALSARNLSMERSCCSSWGQRLQQFFSATKQVISSPGTPCVLISSAQNKLSKQGLLQLCSSEMSECRTFLITGGDLLFVQPLLWSDAQILASFVFSPSPHPSMEKLYLSATGTQWWQHRQNVESSWAKSVVLKAKYPDLACLSHFKCEQP